MDERVRIKLNCPKCKHWISAASTPSRQPLRCPKCASAVKLPDRWRNTSTKRKTRGRVFLGLLAVTGLGMLISGLLAWSMHNRDEQTVPAEPEVASANPSVPSVAAATAVSPPTAHITKAAEARNTPRTKEATAPAPNPQPEPLVPARPAPSPKAAAPAPAMPKPAAPAAIYWLGRKPDPARNEYVFDVRVPADLAALLTCSDPRHAPAQGSIQKIEWHSGDRQYTLLQNRLVWTGNQLDTGRVALAALGVGRNEANLSVAEPDWKACQEQLIAQAETRGQFSTATLIIVKGEDAAKPELRVNLDADRPYDITRNGPTKKPQIVAVAQKTQLYIGWQAWNGRTPTTKIMVHKIHTDALDQGKLTAVREVASLGILVGFTVDESGTDYVLTAKAEDFANNPTAAFVNDVHKPWRKDVLLLHRGGTTTDLNSDRYTGLTFYGLTSSGSGRLAVGSTHLAAVFARLHFTPADNLIHQEGSDFLANRDLSQVPIKAGNAVSHSFDQRLIFDGTDFVTLHQADTYPYAGLIVEKLIAKPRPRVARFNAYACPTFGNSVFFELGGLAAEADGYPVLFTATRNTAAANEGNVGQLNQLPYDLAMVYLVRGFDGKPGPKNAYDSVGSGILANGFAPDQEFNVDNFTWNPATSRYDKREPRTIRRRVLWLTEHEQNTRAAHAKLVKLRDGQYIALWEEQGGRVPITRAMTITIKGPPAAKTITKGQAIELKDLRLHPGDDALAVTIKGVPHAAWVTAGAASQQFLLHTLDADLAYQAYPLTLP